MNARFRKIASILVLMLLVVSGMTVIVGAQQDTDVQQSSVHRDADTPHISGRSDIDIQHTNKNDVASNMPNRAENTKKTSERDMFAPPKEMHRNIRRDGAAEGISAETSDSPADAETSHFSIDVPKAKIDVVSWNPEAYSMDNPYGPVPLVGSTDVVIKNLHTGDTYYDVQEAVDAASDGDSLTVAGVIYGNLAISGKNLSFVDSSFSLYGNLLVDGGSLTIDPSWVNMSGNWYIAAGELNITDNTVVQFNNSYDGEFGIQVNATGTLLIRNGSTIQSNGTAAYWFNVLSDASLSIRDSVIRDCGWNESNPGLMVMANDTHVYNGTFTNCGAGMVLFGVNGATIENSTFYGNFMGGIGLINGSTGNYIANNSFDGGEGVHMENSGYTRIVGNTVSNGTYGLYMNNGTYNIVSDNTISADNGIVMNNSDNNTFFNNSITFGKREDLTGLAAYWKMDEVAWTGAAGEVIDSSGNGKDGTAINGANTVPGLFGRCGRFNGVNNYVSIPNNFGIFDGSQPFTISAWINSSATQDALEIVSVQGERDWHFGVFSDGNFYFGVYDGTVHDIIAPYSNGVWQQFVGVYDPTSGLRLYRDGTLVASDPWTGTANAVSRTSAIGAEPTVFNQYFNGLVDDVRIYSRALSSGEISSEYNTDPSATYAGVYMKNSPDNILQFNSPFSTISGNGDTGTEVSVAMDNSSATISNLYTNGSDYGLVCNRSSAALLNSTIENDIGTPAYLMEDSHVVFTNTSFDKSAAQVTANTSDLTVRWYLDAYVRDSGGAPVSGAWINATDIQRNYFNLGMSDASGHAGPWPLVEYVQYMSGKTYSAPYNIYADSGGLYGSEPALLDSSMSVYITVCLQYVHNVEQDTWYAGITPAVIMANPGEHLEIYGGVHNESVLVDKAVHIVGVVTPLPIINGAGVASNFDVSAEGVEISNLNITNTGFTGQYGIKSTAGGFEIHDNVFNVPDYSIYVDIYHSQEGSMSIGGMNIYNNRMEGGGIFFNRIQFDHPLRDSTVTVGQIDIYDNRINSTSGSGVEIYIENTQYLYGTTSVDMAGISFTGNQVNSSSESLYLYMDYAGYRMYDRSTFSLGDIDIEHNIFNSTNSNTIYLDIGYSGYYMYNNTRWSLGTVNISYNTVINDPTLWGYAIDAYIYDCGEEIYGDSFVSLETWNILWNNITSRYGIYIGPGDCGYSMYDNSEVVLHDWNIMHNHVDVARYGIEFDYYDIGEEMYDNSRVTGGNNAIMYNYVKTESRNAYYLYYDYIGYDMYDSSLVSVGRTDTSYNTFHTNTSNGMYIEIYNLGAYMEGDSRTYIGDFTFTHNDVISNTSSGINFGYWEENGYYNRGNSYVEIGDVLVNDNTITTNNSTGRYGIYLDSWDYNGAYLMDFATVVFGDFEFNNNTISSGNDGIYMHYWYDWGYELSYDPDTGEPQAAASHVSMGHIQFNGNTIDTAGDGVYIYFFGDIAEDMYGSSTFSMGNYEVCDNIINAAGYGIDIEYLEYLGYDMFDHSKATFGDFLFNNNTIDAAGSYGLYIYDFYENAYDMHGYSEFTMGNFEMCYNTVNASGGDAIYPDYIEEIAYYMFDHSKATFGDFLFNWNTVTNASGYAFYSDYIDSLAYYMYDSSIAVFGDFEFNNNTMHSEDSGVYIYNDYWGNYMYDSSRAYFGHIQMNDNTVNTTGAGNPGIDLDDIYEFAYEMYDDSYFEMGNMEVMRNDIKTNLSGGGEGIDIDIEYLGEDISGNSQAVFGDFLFNDNHMLVGGDGIYNDFEEVGYGLNDYSSFSMGNIEFCGNTIDSRGDGMDLDYFYYFAEGMYDYSSFTMGDVNINDNIINSADGGIYFAPYEWGTDMYYGSTARIGSNHIINNTITAESRYGISVWWGYYFGHGLYQDASLSVGDCMIDGNTIETYGSGSRGIETGPYESGIVVYDNSVAEFGNYTVSYNTVFSNQSNAIEFYYNDVACTLIPAYYSSSAGHVTVGDMHIEENDATAPNGYGIYMDYEFVGVDVHSDSWTNTGDVLVRNNTVSSYDGIYVYMSTLGYMYDASASTLGMLDIGGNTVSANNTGGYGIEIDLYQVAYRVYEVTSFHIGDIYVHDNGIQDSHHGLYLRYEQCGYTTGDAYAEIPGIYAYRNTINAADRGIYLFGRQNPYAYPGGTQVWGTVEIYDSTVNSGNGTYIDADSLSTKPDIWIHDVTFTKTGTWPAGIGIQGSNGRALFERCDFSGYDTGIYADGSDLTVGSSTFSGVTEKDINMTNAAHVFMVDDAFNKTNVLFQDNDSILDIGWYITVNVVTQTGNGIPYASVRSVSNTSAPTVFWHNYTVDAHGQYTDMLREYRQNITGIIEQYNPYNMTGSKAGLTGYMVPDPTPIDSSKDVYIILTDNDPPVLGEDTSDTSGTTGDPFTFRVNATDTIGMDYVTVYYRYGSSGAYSSAVMSSSDNVTWTYTMNLAPDYVGSVEYYFVATDLAGNTDTGSVSSFPESDNDAPSGLLDSSPAIAESPSYEFNMTISDNIGVTGVYVVYWFDSGAPTNASMSGTGPYTYSISVTYQENSTLHYYFTARDAAGNWFIGPVNDVPVEDNQAPVIGDDNSDTSATTGDTFHFSVNVTDDFGVGSVTVTYWFGSGEHVTMVLNGTGTYTGSIIVPSDSTETLHYFFNATDIAGNYVVSGTTDVSVTDNDLPWTADLSMGDPIQGDTYVIIAEAGDNVGLASVSVEYWFDNGTHTTENMTEIGDIWMLFIHVPSYATELHYIFNATDTSGNFAVSSAYSAAVMEPSDEEAPQIVDTTTAVPSSGRQFTFSAYASDNVEVARVYVEYWFDNGTHMTEDMQGSGDMWEYTITVPQSAGELHYLFTAEDTSGNSASTSEKTLSVESEPTDTTAPEISDTTTGTPEQSAPFTFSAIVTDDSGVSAVYVIYWFDDATYANMSMSYSSGVWTYETTVPQGVSVLHYSISARDIYGNWASIPSKDLNISVPPSEDTTPPVLGNASISGDIREGATVTLSITVTDNGEVSLVYVEYWADSGEHYRILLTASGDTYTGSFIVPEGSTLHYFVEATDAAGNSARTSEASSGIEPSSNNGTISPAEITGSNILPYLLVIIILLVLVIYLAATRNKGSNTPEEMHEESEPEQAETGPETEEEAVQEEEEYENEGISEEGSDDTDDISEMLEEEE